MTITDRRRALMGAAKKEKPNGLLPGTGYGKGSSNVSVNDDGNLVLTAFNSGWGNNMNLPLIRPITLHNGDSVRLKITKKSGSANTNSFGKARLNYNGLIITDNDNFAWNKANVFDKTVTSTIDLNVTYLFMTSGSNNVTGPATYTVQIYINGEAQFE